jgi:hypothetical protein
LAIYAKKSFGKFSPAPNALELNTFSDRPLCYQHGMELVLMEPDSLGLAKTNLLALQWRDIVDHDVLFYWPGLQFLQVRVKDRQVAWVTACFLQKPKQAAVPKLIQGVLRFICFKALAPLTYYIRFLSLAFWSKQIRL